jgi:hypothetical protein
MPPPERRLCLVPMWFAGRLHLRQESLQRYCAATFGRILLLQSLFHRCCAVFLTEGQLPQLGELHSRREMVCHRALPGGAYLSTSQPEGKAQSSGDPDDPGNPGN